jgi:hypothetical protein
VEDRIGAGGAAGASEAEGGLGEGQRTTGGEWVRLKLRWGLLSINPPREKETKKVEYIRR